MSDCFYVSMKYKARSPADSEEESENWRFEQGSCCLRVVKGIEGGSVVALLGTVEFPSEVCGHESAGLKGLFSNAQRYGYRFRENL